MSEEHVPEMDPGAMVTEPRKPSRLRFVLGGRGVLRLARDLLLIAFMLAVSAMVLSMLATVFAVLLP